MTVVAIVVRFGGKTLVGEDWVGVLLGCPS